VLWVASYSVEQGVFIESCREVATLVEVDEATLEWECLEYARIRVRVLQSTKAEMSKGFRINGVVYNINIVEEVEPHGGAESVCKCALNHYSSSDSVSSTKSFVENTFLPDDSGNLEGGDEEGNRRRPKKTDGEGSGGSTTGTKKAQENECADWLEVCQKRRNLPFTRKELCKQGLSVDGSTLSANQKISDACALIQKFVANLGEEVGISSFSNSRPKPIEAHPKDSCQ